LCIEAFDSAFAGALWQFVEAGGYSHQQKSTGRPVFYRFDEPKRHDYPQMLELSSRVPDALQIGSSDHLIPIPAGQAAQSLSAILLDPVYYEFIHAGRKLEQDLPIVGPDRLIPLKARAWLDLTERRTKGERVDERDIRKHRNDIIRLYGVLDPASPVAAPVVIREDLSRFLLFMKGDKTLNLSALGLRNATIEEIIETLTNVFGLR
jgi:hypothetical protein